MARIINQELIKELKDPNITIKRYDQIQNTISRRVEEIWHFICNEGQVDLAWWSYSNDYKALLISKGCLKDLDYETESNDGFFDPIAYKKFISLIGEWDDSIDLGPYTGGFPTSLLFDKNWHQTIINNLSSSKGDLKQKLLNELSTLSTGMLKRIVKEYCYE